MSKHSQDKYGSVKYLTNVCTCRVLRIVVVIDELYCSCTEAEAAVVLFLHSLHPALVPGVREVDEQDELHEDEEEAADHSDDHPRQVEPAAVDEERAHQDAKHQQQLDAPEAAQRNATARALMTFACITRECLLRSRSSVQYTIQHTALYPLWNLARHSCELRTRIVNTAMSKKKQTRAKNTR